MFPQQEGGHNEQFGWFTGKNDTVHQHNHLPTSDCSDCAHCRVHSGEDRGSVFQERTHQDKVLRTPGGVCCPFPSLLFCVVVILLATRVFGIMVGSIVLGFSAIVGSSLGFGLQELRFPEKAIL
jgi:hypothetical protein